MKRGSCLGWSIESDLQFEFLRPLAGTRRLQVEEWEPDSLPDEGAELLVRWRARPDRVFHGSVHRTGEGALLVDTSDAGWFRVWPERGVVEIPRDADHVAREVRLWTTPMLLLSTIEGLTPLHAACVEIGGRAVAISAPGHFGKTTLAAALMARGHGLLTEDITVVDDAGIVLPGPDLLRLRPPAVDAIELPEESHIVARTDQRVFVRTASAVGTSVPLAAVVLLKVGEEQRLSLRSDPRRLADLWQVSFHLPNLSDRERAFGAIAQLADSIPMYDLQRPLDWSSMQWTMDAVEGLAHEAG